MLGDVPGAEPWAVQRAVPSTVLVAALPVGRGGWEDRVKKAKREEDKGGKKAQDKGGKKGGTQKTTWKSPHGN